MDMKFSLKKHINFNSNFFSSNFGNYLLKQGFKISHPEYFKFGYKDLENCGDCRYWNKIDKGYQNGYCNKLRRKLDFDLKFPKKLFEIFLLNGFRVITKQNFYCNYFDFKRKIKE